MSAVAHASELVTYVTAGVAWTFIVMYQVLSRGAWHRDPIGRHLMALAGVDAGIFTMASIAYQWPALAVHLWFLWSYLGVVAGIAVVTGWRAVILWRLYRSNPPADAAAPPVHRRRRVKIKVRHPFLLWQSILAGLQVTNASLVGGGFGEKLALFVGAAQVATAFYAHGSASAPAVAASSGGTS